MKNRDHLLFSEKNFPEEGCPALPVRRLQSGIEQWTGVQQTNPVLLGPFRAPVASPTIY
jgi:hypothetical protein